MTDAPDSSSPKATDDLTGSRLLAEIVQQTLSQSGESLPANPAVVAALKGVRARHAEDPVDLDAVAPELVEAVLAAYYAKQNPAAWADVSKAVAQSICEDPTARERLAGLWRLLKEG